MVGTLVIKQNIPSLIGENTYEISADQLKSGIYFYTINDGKKSITKQKNIFCFFSQIINMMKLVNSWK